MKRALGALSVATVALVTGCPLTTFEIAEPPPEGAAGSSGAPGAGTGGMVGGAGRVEAMPDGGEGALPPPMLAPDAYAILQGEALNVLASNGVLANDSPVGLSVVGWRRVGLIPSEFDAKLDIKPGGDFSFRPTAEFFGTYPVMYRAESPDGTKAEGSLEIRVVPTHLELESVLAGIGGFVIRGVEGDALGVSLDGLSDVDEDGKAEILIGAPGAEGGRGAVYLVHGQDTFDELELQILPSRTSEQRFQSLLGAEGDAAGVSVSSVGDLDGDGLSDIAIGANGGMGRAYIVTGPLRGGTELPNEQTFTLLGDGVNGDVGRVVLGVGDANGDGTSDVLVSATSQAEGQSSGWIHVISGSNLIPSEGQRSRSLFGATSLVLRAAEMEDAFPLAAARVGDIDGDERDEIFLASHSSFLLLQGADEYPDNAGEPAPDGTSGGWSALRSGPPAPASVSRAGDVDGDGRRDVAYCEGVLYCRVVFGPPTTLAGGWTFVGFAPGTTKLLAAGGSDVDGDGFSDLLFADDSAAYVIYGKPTGHTEVNVARLGSAGYSIRAPKDGTITAATMLGDVNGDGVSDFALADASADEGAGRVYVLFGVISDLNAGDE